MQPPVVRINVTGPTRTRSHDHYLCPLFAPEEHGLAAKKDTRNFAEEICSHAETGCILTFEAEFLKEQNASRVLLVANFRSLQMRPV